MEAQCVYSTHIPYTCHVKSIFITQEGSKVKTKSIKHEREGTNSDVERMIIEGQVVNFLPRNLSKLFPNLKRLTVIRCGLEKIFNEDLAGFTELEEIDFSINNLTSLPDNLFVGMKNLKSIYFDDNKLETLSPELLKPIEGTLEVAGFENNSKINDFYGRGFQCHKNLEEFKKSLCLNNFVGLDQTTEVGQEAKEDELQPGESNFNVHRQVLKSNDVEMLDKDRKPQIDDNIT